MAFQLQKSDPTSSTWADPAEPTYTVRLKQVSAPKQLAGEATVNHATEIIISRLVDVTIGGETVRDTLSVRMRVSGAVESKTSLDAMADLLCNTLTTAWTDASHWIGFTPTAVPVVPV